MTRFDDGDIKHLAERSAANNRSSHITGYLYYYKDSFIQYLEGPEQNVKDLYTKVSKDTRHAVELMLDSDNLEQRLFPGWDMKNLVSPKLEINSETILHDHLVYINQIMNAGYRNEIRNVQGHDDLFTWTKVEKLASFRKRFEQLTDFELD